MAFFMSSQVLGVLVTFVIVHFQMLAASRTFPVDCTRDELDYIDLLEQPIESMDIALTSSRSDSEQDKSDNRIARVEHQPKLSGLQGPLLSARARGALSAS